MDNSRGYSKAQMCLRKILHIITSIPPIPNHQQNSKPQPSFRRHVLDSSSSSNSREKPLPFDRFGFPIDLNLELTSSPETEKSSVGVDFSEETKLNQEKRGKEEISSEGERNPNSETDVEEEKKEGPLPSVTETGEPSSENGDLEHDGLGSELGTQEINREVPTPQLVMSRRERRRVLPCRYKDSVIQPLVRKRKRQRLEEAMRS